MDSLAPVFELFLGSLPSRLDHLGIGQFVIDTIATKHDVVVVVFNFETLNVWGGYDDLWITLILSSLCFNVTKCA